LYGSSGGGASPLRSGASEAVAEERAEKAFSPRHVASITAPGRPSPAALA